ncbi:MAG TPA: glucose-1-phosphate cytidylyltransferase [Vicinamibacterales bacterium]|nr:glucose-1-phosphate cytidylyltransferase [Vicinamibacterales bacterium]
MKVMILCGGMGTRLGGANGDLPKPMVPIGGRPILWHIMKGFAHVGFNDFVLCLGYRSDVIKQYFLNLASMIHDVTIDMATKTALVAPSADESQWRLTLAETGVDSMTGYRIRRAAVHLDPQDDIFAVTYGDGVTDLDFRKVVAFHRSHGRLATVTAVHPPGRFGELQVRSGGGVSEFNEKPQVTAGWISGGFFVFSRAVLDRIADDPSVMLEEQPLQQLARDGQLMAYAHDGFWYCMDTPRDLQQLSRLWTNSAPWATWTR